MTPKIILLNGPPRCGKDTAGGFLAKHFGAKLEKFAQPIRDAMCVLFGIQDEWIEELKHEEMLGGHTLRELMIAFSEEYLKKYGGPRVFGDLLVNRLRQRPLPALLAITDSGFQEEAEVLVETFGAENVKLARIYRPGHDFRGDSRSYIELEGVETYVIQNDGDLRRLHEQLLDLTTIPVMNYD